MIAVGIKNLKNNLSKYLDMVREGEVIYVTDREDVIAEIHKPIAGAGVSADLWSRFNRRVSSILLNVECWIGMRRHFARNQLEPRTAWLKERTDFLSAALTSVHVLPVDERILGILKERAELSECRTMDALHLATALHFSEGSDAGLVVVSLDERLRQTAAKLKLEILPA